MHVQPLILVGTNVRSDSLQARQSTMKYEEIVRLVEGLRMNEWLLRGLVLLSFTAHLVLVLLAGIRRHRASGGRRVLLWLAYQLATWSAPSALSKLFLGNTSQDERLHAFWMPFLLMHLALPDNMSAYALEDNVLALRQVIDVFLRIVGSSYALYKHIIIATDAAGTLLPASYIMFSLGVSRYVENAFALWQGKLSSIRSSIKKHKGIEADDTEFREGLNNEGALLVAHRLLDISKGGFADYSVGISKTDKHYGRIQNKWWEDMWKVVEMELSLMYDIMYTKAGRVHTWYGYIIRLASPLFIVVALLLFFFHSTDDGQRIADVAITYILLVGTLVLEVGWLIRAVVSTWTYALLRDDCLLERRWWHGLRRFAVALGASSDPSRYRRWSGTVGQYNILSVTTQDNTDPCSQILKYIGVDETWRLEYQYSKGLEILPPVRDLLFERIWRILAPDLRKKLEAKPPVKHLPVPAPAPAPALPLGGVKQRREIEDYLEFGREFQEKVFTWHIATHIFLLCRPEKAHTYNFGHVKAIEELSNYMMFLVVARPSMLPGVQRRSLHDATRGTLDKLWKDFGAPGCTAKERKLAAILREEMPDVITKMLSRETPSTRYCEESFILPEGTLYAELMLARLSTTEWDQVYCKFSIAKEPKPKKPNLKKQFEDLLRLDSTHRGYDGELTMQKMLELILDSWVHLLIYAAIGCSRESHAKQLSCGGELTTVVWMLAEHTGTYRSK